MEENVRPYAGQPPGGQLPPGGHQPPASSSNQSTRPPSLNVHALALQTMANKALDDPMFYDVGSLKSGSATSNRFRMQQQLSYQAPKKSWKKRFKDGFRSFVAFVFSNIGICVLVIGYLMVGAVMFQGLEGPEEKLIRYTVGPYRKNVVKKLWKITEEYNTLHPVNWTREVSDLVKEYQARIIKEAAGGYDGSDIPNYKWTFTGALLYSITVITTIGYGHIAPVTPVGKLVTIFYAIIGIPLFLLYLSNIGDIMAKSFKWTYSRLCKCQRGKDNTAAGQFGTPGGILKRPENFSIKYLPQHVHGASGVANQDESNSSMASGVPDIVGSEYSDEFQPRVTVGTGSGKAVRLEDVTVPISLCLLVMVSYVVGGALLFSEWEGWGYLEGSYFCFITLSTIGFGDMVPGDSISDDTEELLSVAPVNNKFVLCSMYILIGMALIAMCFNLMQEKVIKGVRSLGKRLARKSTPNAEEQ